MRYCVLTPTHILWCGSWPRLGHASDSCASPSYRYAIDRVSEAMKGWMDGRTVAHTQSRASADGGTARDPPRLSSSQAANGQRRDERCVRLNEKETYQLTKQPANCSLSRSRFVGYLVGTNEQFMYVSMYVCESAILSRS